MCGNASLVYNDVKTATRLQFQVLTAQFYDYIIYNIYYIEIKRFMVIEIAIIL